MYLHQYGMFKKKKKNFLYILQYVMRTGLDYFVWESNLGRLEVVQDEF